MLDARLVAGSEPLFDELLLRYKRELIEGERADLIYAMKVFRKERRKKYGSHSYLLEPNIKECI